MKQSEYTTRVLTAEPGHYLTQSADVSDNERVVAENVYLGVNDSADNWREITAEEAETIRAAQRARVEAARAEAMARANAVEGELTELITQSNDNEEGKES